VTLPIHVLAPAGTITDDSAPVGVRVTLLILLAGLGIALGLVGSAGWRGRLRRDGRFGVRTPSALRTEESFRVANRVAGLPVLVGGVIAVLGGIAAFLVPTTAATVVTAVVGFVGAVVIAGIAGNIGHRAAMALLASKPPVPSGCAGCACGGCAAVTGGAVGAPPQ
jgi:hypothetical protein